MVVVPMQRGVAEHDVDRPVRRPRRKIGVDPFMLRPACGRRSRHRQHLDRIVDPDDARLRPARRKNLRDIPGAATQIDHGLRRVDRQARDQVERGSQPLARVLEVLRRIPAHRRLLLLPRARRGGDSTLGGRQSRRRRWPALTCRCRTREKIAPSRSSAVNSPVIAASAVCAAAQILGQQLERRPRRRPRVVPPPRVARPHRAMRRDAARARGMSPPCPRAFRRARGFPAAAARRPHPSSRRERHGAPHDAGSPPRSGTARTSTFGTSPGRSILLWTTSRGSAPGIWARIAASSSAIPPPALASTSTSARSARATAAQVRSMPSVSMGSSVGRSPAVSTIVSGMPRISICDCTASRVVPAIGVTIATASPAS